MYANFWGFFQVEYAISHDGTNGIANATVTFVLQTITASNLPLLQTYKSSFTNVSTSIYD